MEFDATIARKMKRDTGIQALLETFNDDGTEKAPSIGSGHEGDFESDAEEEDDEEEDGEGLDLTTGPGLSAAETFSPHVRRTFKDPNTGRFDSKWIEQNVDKAGKSTALELKFKKQEKRALAATGGLVHDVVWSRTGDNSCLKTEEHGASKFVGRGQTLLTK
jgi:hypothetical protein